MFSKKHIFCAIGGLAFLALPVSSFAGHRFYDDDQRPFAWRGDDRHQGHHEKWRDRFEDHHDRWRDRVEDRGERRRDWFEDGGRGRWGQAGPGWYGTPAARPPVNYYAPVYRPYPPPTYQYQPAYQGDDDGYGESYSSLQQSPPAAMTPYQQRSWLIARRQRAMYVIAQLRARHDSRGAARVVNNVKALNRQIGATDGRTGYGYNNAYSYAPPASYAYAPIGAYPASDALFGAPYGSAPYNGNPALNAFSTIALPLLTGIR
jgi:hypothetical protein